jgi:hypothetical protein
LAPPRLLERLLQRVELCLEQRAGAGDLREPRHAMGGGLGAVGGAEGIHHEHVAQRGHAPRQRIVVVGLADVEAHVLEQLDLTRRDVHPIEPAVHQRHVHAEQAGEVLRHRGERGLGLLAGGLALVRPAEVRHHQHGGALGERHLQRRYRGDDAGIGGDHAVVDRHVEVFANQHALAAEVQRAHLDHVHASVVFLLAKGNPIKPGSARARGPPPRPP